MPLREIALLCPQNHLLLKVAYNPDKSTKEEAAAAINDFLKTWAVNPYCNLCKSTKLWLEDRDTGATEFHQLVKPFLEGELATLRQHVKSTHEN